MTQEEFRRLASERIIYLDGATGSNLLKRGMPGGVCPEQWILENRSVLISLQQEYIQAGSNIIYAPTFSANRIKLQEYRLADRIKEINQSLVRLSLEAAENKALVAGDITMTGRQLAPTGTMQFEELTAIYREQITYLAEAGADLLVIETMMSLQEARAALIAAKEVCDLPVLVTMTFEADGRCLFGTDARTAAVTLESLGAAAVGVNCSAGPDKMTSVIQAMAEASTIPIIAKPNAGLPTLGADGGTEYDMSAAVFAQEMKKLAEAGASLLGGCCGSSPEYIRLLLETVGEDLSVTRHAKRREAGRRWLTSERMTLEFGLEDPFIIVGERINPTGKKKLQAELLEGSLLMVREFAEEQEAMGAGILDINVGMGGIDEKDMMLKVLEETGQITSLPLSLDTSYVEVMEAALRHYPGRALMNSISLESSKCEPLLKLAVKYGAMFILLPLSDKGLPESLEEKIQIIDTIAGKALSMGLSKEDIVVDGLVATVGANADAALETLETLRYCKENGFATICGLSNISFGLPERGYVNAAFLTMAIQAGLTMAIANPSQQLLVSSAYAADLLLHKPEADNRYIALMNARKEPNAAKMLQKTVSSVQQELPAEERVREAVLKGDKKQAAGLAREAVESGIAPKDLLDHYLLPAINEVGEFFDKGKYFLPQLIASAQAMKLAIEYLEPLLLEGGTKEKMPAIVLATVEGDIHDIGKNLVALMLKNYGFEVIDLGKDVPKETIIAAAIEHHASIIALSALMTTTMQEMKRVIEYKKEQGVEALVMVGGAVVTREYAAEIGADGYSMDAADAVRVARQLLEQ